METPATPRSVLDVLRVPSHPEQVQRWNEFATLYTPVVVGWLRRTGIRNDGEDIAQEVMLRLRNGRILTYSPGKGRFRTWLRVVVRTACVDFFRTRRHQPLGEVDGVTEPVALAALDAIDEQDEAEHRLGLLQRAMEMIRPEFPGHQWDAFIRTAIGGQSPNLVAAELGMTPSAVYAARCCILARLREFLRFNFAQEFDEDFP